MPNTGRHFWPVHTEIAARDGRLQVRGSQPRSVGGRQCADHEQDLDEDDDRLYKRLHRFYVA